MERLPAHDDFHTQDAASQHHRDLKPPKIMLRSMSKSDPNLNVPHLMLSQDEEHPSINKILSGIFQVNNALPVSAISKEQVAREKQQLHNDSVVALQGESSIVSQLRKSSSALDCSELAALRKTSTEVNINSKKYSVLALLAPEGSLRVSNSYSNFEQQSGGLVMSNPVATQQQNMSLMTSVPQAQFSQALASASASTSVNPLQPNVDSNAGQNKNHHGLFGSMFRQGFFSRPVERTEDENYRYLMALDR